MLMSVAAWLGSLHAVHRRRAARRHFTSMTLLAKEERRADWVLGLMLPHNVIQVGLGFFLGGERGGVHSHIWSIGPFIWSTHTPQS